MNPYIKLKNRKRTWTPVQPTKGVLKEGAEETIKRALAIRHMELPVGEFISQGLEKEVPEAARTLLESNVKMRLNMISLWASLLTPMGLISSLSSKLRG